MTDSSITGFATDPLGPSWAKKQKKVMETQKWKGAIRRTLIGSSSTMTLSRANQKGHIRPQRITASTFRLRRNVPSFTELYRVFRKI